MALSLKNEKAWETHLTKLGIPKPESTTYAQIFIANRIEDPTYLSKEDLRDMNITIMGDILAIIKKPKRKTTPTEEEHSSETHARAQKMQSIPLPKVTAQMTQHEFRKFKVDWSVYKKITQLPEGQTGVQMYAACDNTVQSAIVNSIGNIFFEMKENDILTYLENTVTQKSNPAVHRLTFSAIQQNDSTIQKFLQKLKASAKDCEFECPQWKFDMKQTSRANLSEE